MHELRDSDNYCAHCGTSTYGSSGGTGNPKSSSSSSDDEESVPEYKRGRNTQWGWSRDEDDDRIDGHH